MRNEENSWSEAKLPSVHSSNCASATAEQRQVIDARFNDDNEFDQQLVVASSLVNRVILHSARYNFPFEQPIGGNIAVECSQTVHETVSLDNRSSSLLIRSLTIVMSSLPLPTKRSLFRLEAIVKRGEISSRKERRREENSLSERRGRTAPFQCTNQQQFQRFYEPIPHTQTILKMKKEEQGIQRNCLASGRCDRKATALISKNIV